MAAAAASFSNIIIAASQLSCVGIGLLFVWRNAKFRCCCSLYSANSIAPRTYLDTQHTYIYIIIKRVCLHSWGSPQQQKQKQEQQPKLHDDDGQTTDPPTDRPSSQCCTIAHTHDTDMYIRIYNIQVYAVAGCFSNFYILDWYLNCLWLALFARFPDTSVCAMAGWLAGYFDYMAQ